MSRLLKYNQAKYAILDIVAKKQMKPGDRFPTLQAMSGQLPFSEICLRRALNDLEAEGFLKKRRGSGIYLAGSLDVWNSKEALLFLQIEPFESTVPAMIVPLKMYLRERAIMMHTMTCINPDEAVFKTVKNCLGVMAYGDITPEWVSFLNTLGVPVLYLGANECTRDLPLVDYDWEEAARLVMKRFMDCGYRRIGVINGARHYYPSYLMAKAYRDVLREHGIKANESDIFWKPPYQALGVRDFLESRKDYDALLLESGSLLHALICSHQFRIAQNTAFGVVGSFDDNFSTDRIIYTKFTENLFEKSGEVFFDSLNNPSYFKSGPCLLKPQIVEKE